MSRTLTPMNLKRVTRVVFSEPVSIFILFVFASLYSPSTAIGNTYVWNNSTQGFWDSDRWLRNGETNLTCCPSSGDVAIINSTDASPWVVAIAHGVTVRELQLGQEGSDFSRLYLLAGDPDVPVVVTNRFEAYNGSSLVVRNYANFVIPTGAVVTFHDSSFLSGYFGTVACNETLKCSITLDGGTLMQPYVAPGILFLDNINIDIIYSRYPTVVTTQNFYVFTNAQVSSSRHILDVRYGRYALQYTSYNATNGAILLQAPLGGTASSNLTLLYSSLRLDDYYVIVTGNSYLIVEASYFEMSGSSTLAVTSGSVVIRVESTFVLDTLEELVIRSNSAFIVSLSSYVSFKPRTFNVTLDNASIFAVSRNSEFDFEGQIFFMANGSNFIVEANSRVNFPRGYLLGDSSTVLRCTDSFIDMFDTFITFSLAFTNCTFISYDRLRLQNGIDLLQIHRSNLTIAGDARLLPNSTLAASVNSSVFVNGDMGLVDARLMIVQSRLTVEGQIYSEDCSSAPKLPRTALENAFYSSCAVIVVASDLNSSGNFSINENGSMILIGSIARLGGRILMNQETVLAISDSTVSSSAETLLIGSTVGVYDSLFVASAGSIIFSGSTYAFLRNASTNIEQGSLLLESNASVLFDEGSILNINRGNVIVDSVRGPFDDFTKYLAQVLEFPSLRVRNGSRINVAGGSLIVPNGNAVYIISSRLFIASGSVRLTNNSFLVAHTNSEIFISGGNLESFSGNIISYYTSWTISNGNISVSDTALLYFETCTLNLEGSVAATSSSRILLNNTDLIMAGGNIELDASSLLDLESNSSIVGVGHVVGGLNVKSGRITYRCGVATNLTVGTLIQSNGSTTEVLVSSSYGLSGVSTLIHATNISLGGLLILHIDPSMQRMLLEGREIVLMTTTFTGGITGNFSQVSINAGDLSCGTKLKSTTRTLSIIFDVSQCSSSSAPAGTPSGVAADGSVAGFSNTGLVVGLIAAIVVALIIIAIVAVFKIPTLKQKVLPWARRGTDLTVGEDQEGPAQEMQDVERNHRGWRTARPNSTA